LIECRIVTTQSRRAKTLSLVILCGLALPVAPAAAQSADELRQPFAVLREAYAVKNPAKAAEAYTSDAKIAFQYPGMPREEYIGTEAIKASIERILQPIRPEWTLDMNFKLHAAAAGNPKRTGLYRIIVNMGERSVSSYGRFAVALRPEDGVWRFSEDISDIATEADYASTSEPEMFMRQ
jgi:hypothetical protein